MTQENKYTAEQEIEALLCYRGNVELFQEMNEWINGECDSSPEFVDEIKEENVRNRISLSFLNKHIFPILETIFIFHEEHSLKCLKWTKGQLKQYDPKLAEFF